MSTHSSAEDHSDTFSCTGSDSTSPSSVASHCDEEEQFLRLQDQSRAFVTTLLKEKKENEIVLKAWAERCRTLEEELGRLARLVQSMELERGSAGIRKSAAESLSTPTAEPTPLRHYVDPNKSMSKQDPPPCNNHYIVGVCDIPRCKFSHLYELTPLQLEEMRRGARFHLCNALKNGVECEDPACCYGHECPRGRACGRSNCAFNDEQHRLPPSSSSTGARMSGSRTRPRRC